MIPALIHVEAHDDYTLALRFDNGESGTLDLRPILDFGVFRKIKDLDEFKRVRVVFDAVEWECGVDLDPEYVYRHRRNPPTSPESQ